jgi:hypothetical protein
LRREREREGEAIEIIEEEEEREFAFILENESEREMRNRRGTVELGEMGGDDEGELLTNYRLLTLFSIYKFCLLSNDLNKANLMFTC